jgi:uncharacterized lipoprotein YmbA
MTRHASLVSHLFLGCLLILFLNSCGTRQPVNYYNLIPLAANQARPTINEAETPVVAIGIVSIVLPDALSRAQIAARIDPQRLKYNDLHRWSGALSENFTAVLLEDVAECLPKQSTAALFPWGSYFQPTHRLILNISRFDGTLGEEVVLAARWTITNSSGKETLHSRKSIISIKVTGGDYSDLVTAQSQAVADLSNEIALAVIGH